MKQYYIFETKEQADEAITKINAEKTYSGNKTIRWCSEASELTDKRFAIPYIESSSDLPPYEIVNDINTLIEKDA